MPSPLPARRDPPTMKRLPSVADVHAATVLLDLAPDFVAVVNRDAQLEYVSGGIRTMLGQDPSDWVRRDVSAQIHPDDLADVLDRLARALAGEELGAHEIRVAHAEGHWVAVELTSRRIDDPASLAALCEGVPTEGIVLCVRDVQERRALFERIAWQASHDSLTGTLSRAGLLDALSVVDLPGNDRAVLRVDLDRFQRVNEYFGHEVGDRYLADIGRRLRAAAAGSQVIARLGSDDFVVVVPAPDARRVADHIRVSVATPLVLDGATIATTTTIGIAYVDGRDDVLAALADAEAALVAAKGCESRLAVFDDAMRGALARRRYLETSLRRELNRPAGLFLQYQPIVTAASAQVCGYEALARWRLPDGEEVSPGEFVPIAEGSGLVRAMGQFLADMALADLGSWQRGLLHGAPDLAINVSAVELEQRRFAQDLARMCEQHAVDPRAVTIEVTESTLMRHFEEVLDRLDEVRLLGCRVAIDDFGTGYSSLSYLRDLPVDVVKIDRRFVARVGAGDPCADEIVATIVQLARVLDLDVVAEGVERPEQAEFLTAVGANRLQGFHFGRPGPGPRFIPRAAGQDGAT